MAELIIRCHGCDEVLSHLTEEEAKAIAESKFNYLHFCARCQEDIGGLVGN